MNPVPSICGNRIAMLFFCFAFCSPSFVQAQCIDTTASPTSSADVSFAGSDYSFSNPVNTLLNDGYDALAGSILQLTNKQTDYLQVKGFGFNIPTAASICGIEVTVVRKADNVLLNLATVTDYNVRVMKGGSPVGTNLADGTTQWSATNETVTYGGNGQLWGASWSPTEINSGNFGFSLSAEIHGTVALFPAARINYISMTVYYLDPTVLSEKPVPVHHNTPHAADSTTLKCYPNPATTFIEATGVIPGERVVLTDIYGKRVFQSAPALTNTIKIDVAHLQSGMYVISAGSRKIKIMKN